MLTPVEKSINIHALFDFTTQSGKREGDGVRDGERRIERTREGEKDSSPSPATGHNLLPCCSRKISPL